MRSTTHCSGPCESHLSHGPRLGASTLHGMEQDTHRRTWPKTVGLSQLGSDVADVGQALLIAFSFSGQSSLDLTWHDPMQKGPSPCSETHLPAKYRQPIRSWPLSVGLWRRVPWLSELYISARRMCKDLRIQPCALAACLLQACCVLAGRLLSEPQTRALKPGSQCKLARVFAAERTTCHDPISSALTQPTGRDHT